MKAQEKHMVDEMVFGAQRFEAFVQPTERKRRRRKKKEHLLDYKSTVWCGFPTFSKYRTFHKLSWNKLKKGRHPAPTKDI